MVKITNPLGEVKIGKQGEVVYQRRYGEQIRRGLSPKRAIPSEAQINHRQLYRDALTWRKALSLPNRRYLDGYCIASWVVDGHHIPLPWSRFALKLYLEKVNFIMQAKPTAGESGEQQKFEYYDPHSTDYSKLYGTNRKAQTFTPLVSHEINKIGLYLSRNLSLGTSYIEIRTTDESGHPTAEKLTGIEFDGNTLPSGSPTNLLYFDLPPCELTAGVKYAIWFRQSGGSSTHYMCIRYALYTGTYPRGIYLTEPSDGFPWVEYDTIDVYFEEHGTPAGQAGVLGLLHVRHPALLTVTHKRGAITIRAYDTLSSLNDEYLTKQVGLDVASGDTVDATTLAGLNYHYEVK